MASKNDSKDQLELFEHNNNLGETGPQTAANDDAPPNVSSSSGPGENDNTERKPEDQPPPGKVWVYTPYITVNGKRIPHPTGGVFRFPGDPDYNRDD